MQIENNKVVQFHYHLSEEGGNELENSHDGEPVAYLHGRGGIIRGLEDSMQKRESGDIFSVTVPPEMGYGLRSETARQRIPIKHLIGKGKPKVGQIAHVQTDQGQRQVVIEKVGKFNVDVDTNHPLAGKTLVFDVEIVNVRDATTEELAHGHAHGAGGHQH